MSGRPTSYGSWNTNTANGTPTNYVVPPTGLKQTGYAPGDHPAAQHVNWVLETAYEWQVWLDQVARSGIQRRLSCYAGWESGLGFGGTPQWYGVNPYAVSNPASLGGFAGNLTQHWVLPMPFGNALVSAPTGLANGSGSIANRVNGLTAYVRHSTTTTVGTIVASLYYATDAAPDTPVLVTSISSAATMAIQALAFPSFTTPVATGAYWLEFAGDGNGESRELFHVVWGEQLVNT